VKLMAVDTETTGLDMNHDVPNIVAWHTDTPEDCGHCASEDFNSAVRAEDIHHLADHFLIMHNAGFDIPMLRNAGLDVDPLKMHDTFIIAALGGVDRGGRSLDALAERLLGEGKSEDLKHLFRDGDLSSVPLEKRIRRCVEDTNRTFRIFAPLWRAFAALDGALPGYPWVYDTERRIIPVVEAMHRRGIKVDPTGAVEAMMSVVGTIKEIEDRWDGINLNSPTQLRKILYGPDSKASTDAKTLQKMMVRGLTATQCKLARDVLTYRALTKLGSTYLSKMAVTDTLYPELMSLGTINGRFACRNPNMQNLPRAVSESVLGVVRKFVVPREGYYLFSPDYGQAELRWACHYAGEQAVIPFLEGRDPHGEVAAMVDKLVPDHGKSPKELRVWAKNVNFGIIYGLSTTALAEMLNVTRPVATSIIQACYSTFQGIEAWQTDCKQAARTGPLTNAFGRHYFLPARSAYRGPNYLAAGSTADEIKVAMCNIYERVLPGTDAHMLLQVHDELLFEIRIGDTETQHRIVHEMVNAVTAKRVPSEVEPKYSFTSWAEMHKGWAPASAT
jgi:DNA polymerase I